MQGYHGQGSCLRQAAKPSPINGTQSQFSCKKTIPLDMWDVKGNCAKGRSKEALQINRELDNIKAQIIKHYQHLSDREAFVTGSSSAKEGGTRKINSPSGHFFITFKAPCVSISNRISSPLARRSSILPSGVP